MRRASVLLVAAMGIAAVWWFAVGQGAAHPVPLPTGDAPTPSSAGGLTGSTTAAGPERSFAVDGSASRQQVDPALTEPALPIARPATIHGRAVDPAGEPLANTLVSLAGQFNQRRLDIHVAEHGAVDWHDPEVLTTNLDGRFALSFDPPPPYRFTLTLRRGAWALTEVRWRALPPGSDVDLGDVVLSPGTQLSGVVVDTEGVPQPDVEVRLQERSWSYGVPHPRTPVPVPTGDDGTFAFAEPAAAGRWELELPGRRLVGPAELTVEAGEPTRFLRLIVAESSGDHTISGVVVDDLGVPVESVRVSSGSGRTATTDAGGTFQLVRDADRPPEPVTIRFEKPGYERVRTAEVYPWGTSELRLVLPRGLEVEILVTDAETGEPVEEFGIRCQLDPETYRVWSSVDSRLQKVGHHQGGRLLLPGVRRGRNRLVVEAIGSTYLPSDDILFDVTDRGAPRQHVVLHRPVAVTLQVVDPGGDPIRGTNVELRRVEGEAELDPWTTSGTSVVLRGMTDAAGRMSLSGNPGEHVALRLLGPGHRPIVVDDVVLDPRRSPLRIEVPIGATLRGTIGPIPVLRKHDPDPGAVERLTRGDEARLRAVHTGVFLQRTSGEHTHQFPLFASSLPIEADGSFELTGIPEGDWHLYLKVNTPESAVRFSSRDFPLATVTALTEGETRELHVDISHLARARIAGRVFLNGRPLSGASVRLVGSPRHEPARTIYSEIVATSDDGSFVLEQVAGTYDLRVTVRAPDGAGWTSLPGAGSVTFPPGARVDDVFRLRTRELTLRILGSDGRTPVAGVHLHIETSDDSWPAPRLQTDDEGLVRIAHAPIAALALRMAPAGEPDEPARRILVGTVPTDLAASPVTVVLPAASGH